MKKLIALALVVVVTIVGRADVVFRSTVAGAALGAGAGAIVGHNSRSGDAAKGALIGAAAGGMLGMVVGQNRVIHGAPAVAIQSPAAVYQVYEQATPPVVEMQRPLQRRGQWVPDQRPYRGGAALSEIEYRLADAQRELARAQSEADGLRAALQSADRRAYEAGRRVRELADARDAFLR